MAARTMYTHVLLEGWLAIRDSGELKYSLLNVRAIKVHVLLPSLPFNVD